MKKIVCIGGSNIDYVATSKKKLIPETSNIGSLSISSGGVMRNVVYNLGLLTNKIDFISAIGNDDAGKRIKSELEEVGINLITPETNLNTSTYIAINDFDKTLAYSICDNEIINEVSPLFLESQKDLLSEADYIAIDTNLSSEAIDYIIKEYSDKRIIVEGVSFQKIIKIKPYLNKIYLLKANSKEIQYLLNVRREENIPSALSVYSVKNAIISNEENETLLFSQNQSIFIPSRSVPIDKIRSSNGCGDALLSGVLHVLVQEEDLLKASKFGIYLASLVLTSDKSYSEKEKDCIDYSKFIN